MHRRGPSNLNLPLFVCCFDVDRDSQPVPSINYALNYVGKQLIIFLYQILKQAI